jgi:hypothetical protein
MNFEYMLFFLGNGTRDDRMSLNLAEERGDLDLL